MSEAKVIDLDREAVKQGLREGSLVLVDVREPNEFAAGHIPGAVSHPLSTFDPAALPQGKRVVFSCAAGVRSVRALQAAQGAGLDISEHYRGGFKDWAAAGEPIE
jgi:rhodanese-related sulfurtransferase